MSPNEIVTDHRAYVAGRRQLDLLDFVRRTETVENVQERYARFKRRGL